MSRVQKIDRTPSGPSPDDFIFDITVGEADDFQLPLINSGTYNFVVDWGDGNQDTITLYNQAERTHDYTASGAGTYTITISGQIERFQVNNYSYRQKFTEIKQWGNLVLGNTASSFRGCSNMVITATDTLNLTGITTVDRMFENCSSIVLIPNIGTWDVSSVQDFGSMFSGCSNFNSPLNDWDVSSGSSMDYMFSSCFDFNQPLNNWDTSSLVNATRMFNSARVFNQDLDNWDMSNVTGMTYMFYNAWDFNGNVSTWDTSSVNNFTGVFRSASDFNQPLTNWSVVGASSLNYMFGSASNFNQDLSHWDVSGISDMGYLFFGTNFNQDISNWDTSSVTSFANMFRSSDFDQDIGSWDVTSLTNATFMFLTGSLSQANYDALLIGWEAQSVNDDVVFDAGTTQYSLCGDAFLAHAALIADHNWTIADGGNDGVPCPSQFTIGTKFNGAFTIDLEYQGADTPLADLNDGNGLVAGTPTTGDYYQWSTTYPDATEKIITFQVEEYDDVFRLSNWDNKELTFIDASNLSGLREIRARNHPDLAYITMPTSQNPAKTFQTLYVSNNAILASLDFSGLVRCFQYFHCFDCPNLTTITPPAVDITTQGVSQFRAYNCNLTGTFDLSRWKAWASSGFGTSTYLYGNPNLTSIIMPDLGGAKMANFQAHNCDLTGDLDMTNCATGSFRVSNNPNLTSITGLVSNGPINISLCDITGHMDMSNCSSLSTSLLFNDNPNMTSISLPTSISTGNARWIRGYNTGITSLDLSVMAGAEQCAWEFANCPALASVTFPNTARVSVNIAGTTGSRWTEFDGCAITSVTNWEATCAATDWPAESNAHVHFQDNGMSAALVNQILVALNTGGVVSSAADVIIDGTNAAPDSSSGGFDGSAAKTSLQGKGFTVNTN